MNKINQYYKWKEYQNELQDEWRNSVYASIFIFVLGMVILALIMW